MSHPIHKSDPSLGEKVHNHLLKVGLETPMTELVNADSDDKINKIKPLMHEILDTLGLDMSDDSLRDTPNRVAKMYVNEIFWGLQYDQFPKCTAIDNKFEYNDSFVLEKGINLQSSCEHHILPISGFATVAYIPHKKVLGLSKLNRIVEFFAKRPQVQERLSEQICEAISFVTDTPDVAVYIDAKHMCVSTRGIQDIASSTVTLATRGVFSNAGAPIRTEFLSCCKQL